jgi:hypothetical protein
MTVRRSLWVRKLAFPRKVDLSRCNLRTDYQRQTVGILGTLRPLRSEAARVPIGRRTKVGPMFGEGCSDETACRNCADVADRWPIFARRDLRTGKHERAGHNEAIGIRGGFNKAYSENREFLLADQSGLTGLLKHCGA